MLSRDILEAPLIWLYYLADRLWIQRVLPCPANLKRKRSTARSSSRKTARTESRIESNEHMLAWSKAPKNRSTSVRSNQSGRATTSVPPIGGRSTRAAKLQANIKLDEQARALEAFRKEGMNELVNNRSTRETLPSIASNTPPQPSPLSRTSRGTRSSARLRGSADDEHEWQPIPQEWLQSDGGAGMKIEDEQLRLQDVNAAEADAVHSHGGASDDEDALSILSDLTELTDEKEDSPELQPTQARRKTRLRARDRGAKNRLSTSSDLATDEQKSQSSDNQLDSDETPVMPLPDDFVEWEMVFIRLLLVCS
jgi:hypothetical protein